MDQMDSIDQTASCMVSASAFFEIRIYIALYHLLNDTNKNCRIGAMLHLRSLKLKAAATMVRRPKTVLGGSKGRRGNFRHYLYFPTTFADIFCHLLSFKAIFCCFLPFCENFHHYAEFSAILCRFPRKMSDKKICLASWMPGFLQAWGRAVWKWMYLSVTLSNES